MADQSKIDSCKRSVTAYKGYVTRYKNLMDDRTKLTKGDLESMLSRVQTLYDKFEIAQSNLEDVDPTAIPNSEISRSEFETSCRSVETSIRNVLETFQTQPLNQKPFVPTSRHPMSLPLPDIPLPKFDGSFISWIVFRESYIQRVHNDERLSSLLKFTYLENCLRGGTAYHFIQSIPNTNENYTQVWETIFNHYENEPRIKYIHFKNLYHLKPVRKDNCPTALREFIESFWKQYNALKALKVPVEHWDLFLTFHISELVDQASRVHIETNKPKDKIPSTKEIMDILSERARILEAISPQADSYKSKTMQYNKPKKAHSLIATENLKQTICNYCKKDHSIFKCQPFLSMSIFDRNKWVQANQLCHNCLGTHHIVKCKSTSRCNHCKGKHHTLIHINYSNVSNNNDQKSIANKNMNFTMKNSSNLIPSTSSAVHQIPPIANNQIAQNNSDNTNSVLSAPPNYSVQMRPPMTSHNQIASDGSDLNIQSICNFVSYKQILLSTVTIWVESPTGTKYPCRALLDSGSQCNFISGEFVQTTGIVKRPISTSILGINQNAMEIKHKVNLSIGSRINNYQINLDFLVLKNGLSNLPLQKVQFDISTIPQSIELADPTFYKPQKVDMLLGAEIYFNIMKSEKIILSKELPPFFNSVFGYIVCGPTNINFKTQQLSMFCCDVDQLRKEIQEFSKIEDVKIKNNFSIEEKACELHYVNNVKRDSNGRYSVALPTKPNIKSLANNRANALKQFYSLEKRLDANPHLKTEYIQFMEEYISLNQMELVTEPIPDLCYFLPHHPVFKESSTTTKMRAVFNGSSKSASGLSLNDTLMTGPTIQSELLSVIIRFRKFVIAVTADITKMYRQINIHSNDRFLQLIFWRKSTNEPLSIFKLNTVTYGTTSAPFLAIRTLKQLASDEYSQYPNAARILLEEMYVDDLISGADTVKSAETIKTEMTDLLAAGGFELRKWASNNKSIVPLDEENKHNSLVNILGLIWDSQNDVINISLAKFGKHTPIKKRNILSEIAQLYDPLGLCAPVVFSAKRFMQQLWAIPSLGWDDEVPDPFKTIWVEFSSQINSLDTIQVPRCIIDSNREVLELHGFGDASEKGYGCCLYVRSINKNNQYICHILCAKSKVAPLKGQTIPRLELCASLLLAQLYEKVIAAMKIKFTRIILWTDSEITLHRINSPPARYATFVANRVSQIQEITSPKIWAHIPSENNPADLVSRGMMPSELKHCKLWWNGPQFLTTDNEWPAIKKYGSDNKDPEESKDPIVLNVITPNSFFEYVEDYDALLRLSAISRRFLKYLFNKVHRIENIHFNNELTTQEIEDSLMGLVKSVQNEYYAKEIKQLNDKRFNYKTNSLKKLSPFIDEKGLLRIGGRLQKSTLLNYDQKHPLLLPMNHPLTIMIVKKEHRRNLHAGPQSLLSFVRQKFWIPGGLLLCKRTVRDCLICFRNKPTSITQLMGQLPPERIQPSRPFENTGVDYAGPFNVNNRIRSNVICKAYLVIFICFSSKATHIEVVQDATTQAFLAALRRFISRRGRCLNIYSDNATNFVGAASELIKLQQLFNSETHKIAILRYCHEEGIHWHTIPPRSPHFGGLWEAAVKSAKHHLKRILGDKLCSYEELTTFSVQIEACLNSRPLSSMSNDPSDLSPLTPGHFLIGQPINLLPEPSLSHLDFNRLSRYQRLQSMFQHFWKRWSNEYLCQLQQKQKWNKPTENVVVGSLVLLKEDNVPPTKWIIGRVIATTPDRDGLVRVVSVKTKSGIFTRAIVKICVLPIEIENDS